jgi:CHAT domain-containing protein
LGEVGGGEGVYGLQRAFHIAGCRNVIASLWQVDDDATCALMGLFYHQLWVKKQPPLEALRQAQLYVYRHPEQIAALAKRSIDFTETDLPRETTKPAPKGKRAPTSQWAAFVLSGLGQ